MKPARAPAAIIEVRVEHVAQLFNSLDPSPFRSRDLDADAEAHIIEWARELNPHDQFALHIHMPKAEAAAAIERDVAGAIRHYFEDRAHAASRDLAEHFRTSWRYLSIGLPVLAACLIASQFVTRWLDEGTYARIIEESLIIVGWVANWKSIEALLYDWIPLKRGRDLYSRLAIARIEIIAI